MRDQEVIQRINVPCTRPNVQFCSLLTLSYLSSLTSSKQNLFFDFGHPRLL
jgi:hypothetical protein